MEAATTHRPLQHTKRGRRRSKSKNGEKTMCWELIGEVIQTQFIQNLSPAQIHYSLSYKYSIPGPAEWQEAGSVRPPHLMVGGGPG